MSLTEERLAAALADRYRIERELGQGGMATVYLAEDLRHHRQVAIKVLKPELAAVVGAERFLAEIRTTANLQHPGILPLYDSGEADKLLYYVMPYVEGETLRDRLDMEKQLSVDEAVRIASAVAHALDFAHQHGVVHRDIKPGNILFQGGQPVVADFGIALALGAGGGARLTETGLSLGTPYYMSPEQATGDQRVGPRSDIYALGCILHEMLVGDPPYTGSTAQAVLGQIITGDAPAVRRKRPSVPAHVDAVIRRALEKLPADRFETAKAFADALANRGFTHGADTVATGGTRAPWYRHAPTVFLAVVAVVLAGALVAVTVRGRGSPGAATPVVLFALSADPAVHIDTHTTRPFAVSPDGRTVVFRASTDSTPAGLWVRRLGEAQAHPLAGTEGGWNPAISPDGAWVAFITDGHHIRKVRLGGGDVSTVAAFAVNSAALSWASDEEILFETLTGAGAPAVGIQRVSAMGGPPLVAVPLDSAAGEIQQRRPFVLRDAGVVVYGSSVRGESQTTLVAYRLSDGRRTRLGIPGIGALAFLDRHLIYSLADGTLMAVPFDASGMRLGGAPVELLPRVASNGSIGTAVGLSERGTLVYRAGDASAAAHLELVDTTGRKTPVKGDFSVIGLPRFSPDGRRIAVVNGGASSTPGRDPSGDLWVVDATTGVSTRVTTDGSVGDFSWFPDGRRVAFIAGAAGSAATHRGSEIRSIAVDGSAPPSSLLQTRESAENIDVAPDGRSLVVAGFVEQGATLLRHWVDGSSRVDTLLMGGEQGGHVVAFEPRVSPDGRWVAFVESYSSEVWVRSMAGHTLLQASTSPTNATPVVWGPDSRHLYYVGTEGLVDIELRISPTLAVVRRHTIPAVLSGARLYDLSPDGRTFVVARTPTRADDILVAVDWLAEARKAWQGAQPRE